ncbi:MAG: hypothetical protein K940chlam9_01276 [Chlamydiae bacterium]|nr:hypothetical protein [Chlamydiota bacterium]
MQDKIKTFWLGLFILAAIGTAAGLLLFLKPYMGDGERTLRILFTNIDKVTKGTRVTFAGKPVGEVEEIIERKNPRQGPSDGLGNLYVYELILKVDSSVRVFTYDEILFATAGLLGEKSIAIIPRAPPPGAPSAQDVTDEILFARSTDKLEQTLNKIVKVAMSFDETMGEAREFLQANKEDFPKALKSFKGTSEQLTKLTTQINSGGGSLGRLLYDETLYSNLSSLVGKLNSGQGTLGRLLDNDALYLQLSSSLCKVETLLQDINHYGLLFQYNKQWQRNRTAKMSRLRSLSTPCDFYNYFDQEINELTVTFDRLGKTIDRLETFEAPLGNRCFAMSMGDLLARVEHLQATLKLYTENLTKNYCQECTCE